MFSLAGITMAAIKESEMQLSIVFYFKFLWSQACGCSCSHLPLYRLIFENIAAHLYFVLEFFWHRKKNLLRWWQLRNILCICYFIMTVPQMGTADWKRIEKKYTFQPTFRGNAWSIVPYMYCAKWNERVWRLEWWMGMYRAHLSCRPELHPVIDL